MFRNACQVLAYAGGKCLPSEKQPNLKSKKGRRSAPLWGKIRSLEKDRLHEPSGQGIGRSTRFIAGADLSIDILDMAFNRSWAEH